MATTKDKLRSLLSDYRDQLAWFAEMKMKHDAAVATERELNEKISDAGEPDYRNSGALDQVDSLKRQLAACQKVKKDLSDQLARSGYTHNGFSCDALGAMAPALYDAIEELTKRITTRFAPYYSSRERAKEVAQKCDAVITARRYVDNLRNIADNCRMHATGGEDFAEQIKQLATEAVKDAPNFEPFFPLQNLAGKS